MLCYTVITTSFLLICAATSVLTANVDYGDALFLTPYIKAEDFDNAKQLASVQHPDMDSSVISYSGFLTVNETSNSNLFFWYFAAVDDPTNAPVILYLNGGPGMSTLFSAFGETGPYYVTMNATLKPREYAWNKYFHMIYVDNPVGTGFSFGDDDGYARKGLDIGVNMYVAVKQFFALFSELQQNPFYVAGGSFAGKYVPAVGHVIHEKNQHDTEVPKINMMGLAIGSGVVDPFHQSDLGEFFYNWGLVDIHGCQKFRDVAKAIQDLIVQNDNIGAEHLLSQLLNFHGKPMLLQKLSGLTPTDNLISSNFLNNMIAMAVYIDRFPNRNALHAGTVPFKTIESMFKVYDMMLADLMVSVAPWVAELLAHYRILIFHGQLDGFVPHVTVDKYLSQMKFSGDSDFRVAERNIWKLNGKVVGYVKQGGNLTQALVLNSGHVIPHDQPKSTMDLVLRMILKRTLNDDIDDVLLL